MEYCRYSPAKPDTQDKIFKEYQSKLEEGNTQKGSSKKKKN